jgi:hypothetical protein
LHSHDDVGMENAGAVCVYAYAFDEDGDGDEFEPTSENGDLREMWTICRGIR